MSAATVSALLLLLALVAGAWLLHRRRSMGAREAQDLRWVGGLQLGPQHRVVVIEVGPPQGRQHLVLGISAGAITPLHRWLSPEPAPPREPGDEGIAA